jgi:phage host-nuclease inhibitor protein Gam
MEALTGLDLSVPADRERALAWRIEDRPTMEWAMGILARAEQEAEEIRFACAAARGRIDLREEELLRRNEGSTSFIRAAAEEFARTHRKDLVSRGKTAHLVHGEVAYRSTPEKVEVEDPAAALAWCEAQGVEAGFTRIKVEINKKALSEYVLSSGVIPPGCAIVPASETITLKPAAPDTIDAVPRSKEIKP